ncbi:MAG: Hsp20/alpha crystallin family protein [Gammaproteobacteria bacterium]|nr:Hsp20/alpha crystallin family protein [Gammaproteobacteria bacterium]
MNARHHWHLLSDLEDYFDRLERGAGRVLPAHVKAQASDWRPPMDIRETPKEYRIQIELAGVDKDAIDLSTLEGMLTVHGERPLEPLGDGEKHHRIGRMYGHFSRTFALPADADTQSITATMQDGLLTVRLPKLAHPAQGARRVAIT